MSMFNKTIQLMASKLGLGEEKNVIRKAAEFDRRLQAKAVAGTKMTDTSKIVICLDLAADFYCIHLDVKTAMKYSGLKPAMYTNCKKTLENLLTLNTDKLTIAVLCAALQCSTVQPLAGKILEEYQKQATMEIDLNLPQYVCMAVFQACRINKIKVSKTKLLEKSRLKPAQWTKLETDWTKFVDANFTVTKKRGRTAKHPVQNEEIEQMETAEVIKNDEESESKIEPYEDWKRRVLEAAYKELRELEQTETKQRVQRVKDKENENKEQCISPRKSPRKTPQKYSPYKSPVKVKLLFSV